MLLILARHGNTFAPGDTPVWVGAREDLALVEMGLDQSRAIGAALARASITPTRVLAGPLKRTRTGAKLAADQCGFTGDIEIDERLREIDYGVWGGKSDAEIQARWGAEAIEAWRERSVAPEGAGWAPTVAALQANARAVFNEAVSVQDQDAAVLIVTSNGVLRYFHALLAPEGAPGAAKVKTGHMGAARVTLAGAALLCWNASPESFEEHLI